MNIKKRDKFDRLWMDQAIRFSEMSFATRKKVGAVLVQGDVLIASGWNGMPRGLSNDCELHDNTTNPLVVHAEMNVLLNCIRQGVRGIEGSTLYVTLSPCQNCVSSILQTGISRIVYLEEYRILTGLEILNSVGRVSVEKLEL